MTAPRIAVIVFPGGNCETETARAVENAGMNAELFRWNRDAASLADFDGYVIGGGFSYQDRVRAGIIASKEPIMDALCSAADAGKPILGICNGAQILVESGLVPGLSGKTLSMALAPNRMMKGNHVVREGYYSAWARLKSIAPNGRCAFNLDANKGEILPIPFAHAEGRFTTSDVEVEKRIVTGKHVVFAYCTAAGDIATGFPDNPNGSLESAAALCNEKGNVMAMMPHPERADLLRQTPGSMGGPWAAARLEANGSLVALSAPGPGRKIFTSMHRFLGGKS
jgi:phosphoribosylformylglycinamidine synthase subunit PurQ / glutaminase